MREIPVIMKQPPKRLPEIPHQLLQELLKSSSIFKDVYTFDTFRLCGDNSLDTGDQFASIYKLAGKPKSMNLTIHDQDTFPFVSYTVHGDLVNRIKQKDNFQSRIIVIVQGILDIHALSHIYHISTNNLQQIAYELNKYF